MQFWHHKSREAFKTGWNHGRGDHETVAALATVPSLHNIGDLDGVAFEHVASHLRQDPLVRLAHSEALLLGDLNNGTADAGRTDMLLWEIGHGTVKRTALHVPSDHFGEIIDINRWRNQIIQLSGKIIRVLLRLADKNRDARQNLEIVWLATVFRETPLKSV